MQARPVVKWAGGKTQLLPALLANMPSKFEDYYEPFFGGGAFFFKLASMGKITKSHLNDLNTNLITTYDVIKTRHLELIKDLSSAKYKNDEETYYKLRSEEPSEPVKIAARFIYLNKTGFNGLYRVNSKGKFNTPFGKYTNPKILDHDNILAVHKTLQTDELTTVDFEEAVKTAKKGDFVYFDPPYQPLSKTAKFTGYTANSFGIKDQKRLLECFKRLNEKGCFVMLSNSDSPITRDLYQDFTINVVKASRAINCVGSKRGKINELIVTNYVPVKHQTELMFFTEPREERLMLTA